jgi:hypothetical protein
LLGIMFVHAPHSLASFCRKTAKTGTIAGENDIRQIQILARGFRPAQEML